MDMVSNFRGVHVGQGISKAAARPNLVRAASMPPKQNIEPACRLVQTASGGGRRGGKAVALEPVLGSEIDRLGVVIVAQGQG